MDLYRHKDDLHTPVNIHGMDLKIMDFYKNLGVTSVTSNKLDWTLNIDAVYKKINKQVVFATETQVF